MKNSIVEYSKYKLKLNGKLIGNLTNLTIEKVEELKDTYIEMFKIFEQIENSTNRVKIFKLNQQIEPLEFKMQKLFGFKVNRNYHRWWRNCPKCTCPEMDNKDALGTEFRYYNDNCFIHGSQTRNLVERKLKLENLNKLNEI